LAIYRGAGGAGDAVGDASSEVLLALQAKDAAQAAQAAAELAQVAAETAETNAETAETNAETAETNAETAETNAETAATNAASSASAASTSATNAAASASTATTQATNAASSASAASTSASNASTSATNAASSASTATTQATNASNSASAAATSATNASNSASAAATSATNAASSATSASGSASTATTQATNASNSASAASTSATNASNSASAASTSATNASNSASAASTSATNASNSASAASTSASNAASAQTAAESARDATLAAYDSFDDRYLGAKSSAPSLDNDGNALLAGSLYFDTVSQGMKLYTGSAWVDAYVPGSTYLAKANNLSDLTNTGTARTNLGLVIGTDIQAYDADTVKYDDANPTFTATSAIKVPAGTTGERPTGAAGKLRFNSTTSEFEGHNGTTWSSVGGSAISNDTATSTDIYPALLGATTGTAANIYTSNAKLLYKPSTGELKASQLVATNGIIANSATISANYTIASGQNAMSTGAVTVNSGVTVTVSSGSRWVVL
jgi:hypothetical protein